MYSIRTCDSLYRRPESWIDIVHPEDRQHVLEAVGQRLWTGARQIEYRIVWPDVSVRWIRERAFPVYNAWGQVYILGGVVIFRLTLTAIGRSLTAVPLALRAWREARSQRVHWRIRSLNVGGSANEDNNVYRGCLPRDRFRCTGGFRAGQPFVRDR